MKIKKNLTTAVLFALSCSTQAGTMADSVLSPMDGHWSFAGGIGYTWYDFGYHGGSLADPTAQHAIGDGQTAFGRFSIARDMSFAQFNLIKWGLELGIQSGNIMRLDIPQATLDELAGLPIQANIKPMLDLLATATTNPLMNTPAFGVVKAGIAYRRLQINERVTVNDLSQVGFEVQAGLGAVISDRAQLAILYQGIFNNKADFTVDSAIETGHISNIPAQNGVFLALSYTL